MKTIENPLQLYAACPIIEDIANRIEQSRIAADEWNESKKGKFKKKSLTTDSDSATQQAIASYGTRYPDHYLISQTFINGKWEPRTGNPKTGKAEFEKEVLTLISTRKPKALVIIVYRGKSSSPQQFDAWLAGTEDEEVRTELQKRESESVGLITEIKNIKSELEKSKTSNADVNQIQALRDDFAKQLLVIEHKNELKDLRRELEEQIKVKDAEIQRLTSDIESLIEENTDLDGQLGSAAEKIEEKIKPPAVQVLLGRALESGIKNLFINYPKIGKGLNLSPSDIAEIFKEENKSIAGSGENGGEASFTEANPLDYPNQTTPEHKEGAKLVTNFVNSCSLDDFRKVYTIMIFCTDDKGDLVHENVLKLLKVVSENTATDNTNTGQ